MSAVRAKDCCWPRWRSRMVCPPVRITAQWTRDAARPKPVGLWPLSSSGPLIPLKRVSSI